MAILFEKVKQEHLHIILGWLAQDFIKAFWDNSQSHKDDISNFVQGRKTPSDYAHGKYVYWIASDDNEPFAMLMTIQENDQNDIGLEKLAQLSKTGQVRNPLCAW